MKKIELPITLIIENTTDKELNASVLGYHKNWLKPNFGSDSGIKVTVDNPNLSHADVMEHAICVSNKIIIQSENEKQIIDVLKVNIIDANVRNMTIPIFPLALYADPKKAEAIITLTIDKHFSIEMTVQPKTKLKLTFE